MHVFMLQMILVASKISLTKCSGEKGSLHVLQFRNISYFM